MMAATQREMPESVDNEEQLDPRVKVELDILNQCSSDVNRLEREVDEARSKYQQNFTSCSQQLERIKKNLGRSIKKARPYYELKEKAREAQSEALRSARKFQSANGVYLAAKETISLAELRLMDDKAASLSAAWQEMLNHALMRVTEAEKAKSASEKEHLARAAAFAAIEQQMLVLEKDQKRSIVKAREYFEKKKELEVKLQQVKQSIQDLQQAMVAAKSRYAGALRRLETISDCIHEQRRQQLVLMYPREPGVGAEENEWAEQKLPNLSTHDIDECEGYDDSYEYDDVDDDEYNDIDTDSVFRTRVLTTSLDDEDTSFMKGSKSRGKAKKKQLTRSQSLPVNASKLARQKKDRDVLTPFSDREEAYPPDGESVGSGASVGAGSVSSVSSQGEISTPEKSLDNPNLATNLDSSCDSGIIISQASTFGTVDGQHDEQGISTTSSEATMPSFSSAETETTHEQSIERAPSSIQTTDVESAAANLEQGISMSSSEATVPSFSSEETETINEQSIELSPSSLQATGVESTAANPETLNLGPSTSIALSSSETSAGAEADC